MQGILSMGTGTAKTPKDSKTKLIELSERVRRWEDLTSVTFDQSVLKTIMMGMLDQDSQRF